MNVTYKIIMTCHAEVWGHTELAERHDVETEQRILEVARKNFVDVEDLFTGVAEDTFQHLRVELWMFGHPAWPSGILIGTIFERNDK